MSNNLYKKSTLETTIQNEITKHADDKLNTILMVYNKSNIENWKQINTVQFIEKELEKIEDEYYKY